MKVVVLLAVLAVVKAQSQSPVRLPSSVITESTPNMCPASATLDAARATTRAAVQNLFDTAGCGGLGWTQVVNFDMGNPMETCPTNWQETNDPMRSCFVPGNQGCIGPTYPAFGLSYTRVCGRAVGYGLRTPDAFHGSDESIDGAYVDGISVTYGSPRQHIWTFGGGHGAQFGAQNVRCPCGNADRTAAPLPPPFVGDNYFCDTLDNGNTFWDVSGCTDACCMFNNPPFFNRTLAAPTTDGIEVRICADQADGDEDIHLRSIQVYVQ